MQMLKALFDKYVPASFWLLNFLSENRQIAQEIFFECNYPEAKKGFTKMLMAAIQQVNKVEQDFVLDVIFILFFFCNY
jgi:hypothetical protein